MLVLLAVTALSVLLFCATILFLLRRTPELLPGVQVEPGAPLISVIVPARNEERNVGRCLDSVLAQRYPNLEIIVIDDHSTDATPQILATYAARARHLRVVPGQPLPSGWTGKNFAVHQGAGAAHGAWLLFIDADVTLEPDALASAYRLACDRRVAMISLWPRHEVESFWERTAQAVIMGMHLFGDLGQRFKRPWDLDAGPANGQFILIEKGVYDAVGGHAAVQHDVIEDYAFASRVRQAGHPALMVNGSELVNVRMYASLADIWEGWSKNTFLGMNESYLQLLGAVIMVFLVTVSPFLLLAWSLVAVTAGGSAFPALASIALLGMLFLTCWRVRGIVEMPLRYFLGYPLGGLILIGIMLNSAYRHTLGGGVTWKGRRYMSENGDYTHEVTSNDVTGAPDT